VSLVEILIGLLIVIVASIATLTYFSSALGGVGRQSNRRAALERARQRLEQLMETTPGLITPADNNPRWVTCAGSPCSWTLATAAPIPAEQVDVEDIGLQPMETTVQCIHDVAAGTPADTCDVLELGAKVWFIPGSVTDDDFHRVHIRTLRTP